MGIAAQCVHGAKVCVIPHPTNDYKPLILHHKPLAVVAAILVMAKVMTIGVIALTPAQAELATITRTRIIEQVNVEREKLGLTALKENSVLNEAAKQKAQDMLDNDYFAHISPAGVTPWFWFQKANYSYRVAGENLAIDFVEAEDVVAAWMASPTHKENIVQTEYTETGVAAMTGEFQGGTSTVVVHFFGVPQGVTAPSAVEVAGTETEAIPAPEPTPAPIKEVAAAVPAPQLTLVSKAGVVKNKVALLITGQARATAFVLANNKIVEIESLGQAGEAQVTADISDEADGQVVITAYLKDEAGTVSANSGSLTLTKDTLGPNVAEASMVFVASPATDNPEVAIYWLDDNYAEVTLKAGGVESVWESGETIIAPLVAGELKLVLADAAGNVTELAELSLTPSFYTERIDYQATPRRINNVGRRITIGAAMVIIFLLLLAIIIHIQVQHPRMIAQASMVVGLALFLLFW